MGGTLWAWWTLATTLSWAVAGGLMNAFISEPSSALQYLFLPLVAVGQWLVLRRHFARASWWLIATAGGALVAGIFYGLITHLPIEELGPASSGVRVGLSTLFDGVSLGTAQWLVLRGNVSHTEWWIPAVAGPLWLFGFLELDRGRAPTELPPAALSLADQISMAAMSLGLMGLLVGVSTGVILTWLVEQPRPNERDK